MCVAQSRYACQIAGPTKVRLQLVVMSTRVLFFATLLAPALPCFDGDDAHICMFVVVCHSRRRSFGSLGF